MDKKCIAPWDKENCLDKSNCPVYLHEHFCQYAVDVEPSSPATHIIQEGSRQHVISYDSQGRHCSEPNCEINFELQSEPQMPLIEQINTILWDIYHFVDDVFDNLTLREDAKKRIMEAVIADQEAWLPAHDQQVRKALIEEVCKLLDKELVIISPNTEAKLKAHLRAMGGKR
jgi:hypothetical protein